MAKEDAARLHVLMEKRTHLEVEGTRILVGLIREIQHVISCSHKEPAFNGRVDLKPVRVGGLHLGGAIYVEEKTELAAEGGEEGGPLGEVGMEELKLHGDVRLGIDGAVRDETERR